MKITRNIYQQLASNPLMIHKPTYEALSQSLVEPDFVLAGDIQASYEERLKERREQKRMQTLRNVAIVNIVGPIMKGLDDWELEWYGACDLNDVTRSLHQAMNDDNVDTVVLNINSPGGVALGLKAVSDLIATLGVSKEVHAFTSSMMCSAAYYLASQADIITSASDAIVGSIGTIMINYDLSKAYDEMGVKHIVYKGGRLKDMSYPHRPPTEEESNLQQSRVDMLYSEFKAACTAKRAIKDESMQGQWYLGREAKELNIVDQVADITLDEYVSALIH